MSKIKNERYHNKRGVDYHNKRMYEVAIKKYTKALKINPEYAFAYYNRALASGKLNRYEEAIADLNEYIELNPKRDDAYYLRGRAYANLNKDEKARRDYKRAIELNPNYAVAYTAPLGRDLSVYSQEELKELAEALQKKKTYL